MREPAKKDDLQIQPALKKAKSMRQPAKKDDLQIEPKHECIKNSDLDKDLDNEESDAFKCCECVKQANAKEGAEKMTHFKDTCLKEHLNECQCFAQQNGKSTATIFRAATTGEKLCDKKEKQPEAPPPDKPKLTPKKKAAGPTDPPPLENNPPPDDCKGDACLTRCCECWNQALVAARQKAEKEEKKSNNAEKKTGEDLVPKGSGKHDMQYTKDCVSIKKITKEDGEVTTNYHCR